MPIEAGQQIGGYQILGVLGRGAMGEVYLALDPQLGREVAMKLLPSRFAADSERLKRFEREARSLATVNHPAVAQIHGFHQVGDTRFLVLEYVPGVTLEQRLVGGAMPLAEVLEIARQVAAGVEAAHAAGVIHRDLKPANVRITPEGHAKVLDFGLAKLVDNVSTAAPTLTQTGRALGTPSYMAPEQLRGQHVDRRADVWSFGCTLYECLTGSPAFGGKTISAVVAAVFADDPDWSRLPAALPKQVADLVRRCLARDPKQRWQSIGEVHRVLDQVAAAPAPRRGRRLDARQWGVGGIVLGAAVALLVTGAHNSLTAPSRAQTARLVIAAPPGTRLVTDPLLAPFGRRVLFRGVEQGGHSAIYLRDLDSFDTRRLDGTDDAEAPFLSPDGSCVGFRVGSSLRRVPITGGHAQEISSGVGAFERAMWLADGSILWSAANTTGLWRVDADGGESQPFTEIAPGEVRHGLPQPLPGDRSVLFTVWRQEAAAAAQPWVARLDLSTRKWQCLFAGEDASFVAPDHLVFRAADGYRSVRFDPELGVQGKAERITGLDGVAPSTEQHTRSLAVSSDGSLAFIPPAPTDAEVRVVLDWSAELQRP
jgi:eukaryotic-like serine/threonine-protein kinase